MVKISKFKFGSIMVDGKKYNKDVIVDWNGEITNRKSSHKFTKEDLQDLLLKEPETIIIGTGTSNNVKVDSSVKLLAKKEKIEFIHKPTIEALKDFNYMTKKRRTIGVMHLTC